MPNDLIDQLLSGYKKPEDLIGENGLLKQLTKALIERALQAEMTEHLGHDKHATVSNLTGNARNGKSSKTLKGEFGELPIEIPRDREGSFEPQLISKHQTRWTGFDDKIISLYSRGMTVREIQNHLIGDVWCGGFAYTDLIRYRCSDGRCEAMAVPPAGCSLSRHLLESRDR